MNDIKSIIENVEKYEKICETNNATLVLATKYATAEVLQELAQSGKEFIFGENKVQDFQRKYFQSPNVKWHFIGRLQRNKVKYLIGKVDLIQSVDSAELLLEISKQSAKQGVQTNVLIEVNVGLESQKGGVFEENFLEMIAFCDDKIKVKGIMSVFPKEGNIAELSRKVVKLSKILLDKFGKDASIISIGMSNDYLEALKGGSNMIRLGKAIFPLEEKK